MLQGNGDGTFKPAKNYPAGAAPYFADICDCNSDNIPDVIVPNFSANTISLLLGNGKLGKGDGSFRAPSSTSVGNKPSSTTVGDFNKDGLMDVAVANYGGSVSVLSGNGVGGFSKRINFPVGSGPFSITQKDFNRDGKSIWLLPNIPAARSPFYLAKKMALLTPSVNSLLVLIPGR